MGPIHLVWGDGVIVSLGRLSMLDRQEMKTGQADKTTTKEGTIKSRTHLLILEVLHLLTQHGKYVKQKMFLHVFGPWKIDLKWPQMGPGRSFLIQTLPTFWAERIWILRFFLRAMFLHPKFPDFQVPDFQNFRKSGLGQAWAGLGP